MGGGGRRAPWGSRAWIAFKRGSGLTAAATYSPQVWLLAAGTIVSYLGRGAAVPFVVLYLTKAADIPLAWIGLGVVAEQLTRALASPWLGAWSDRFGRKPLMIGGVVLQALAFPSYLLVEGIGSYMAVSILAGLGQAPYQPALSAFLADVTPTHQRVGVFGLVHTTKNLGWGFGVVLGGLLVERSYLALFLAAGALPLVYAALIAAFIREPPRAPAAGPFRAPSPLAPLRMLREDRRFAAFIALAIVIFLTWGQLNTVLPVFLSEGLLLDELWVTRVFALNSVLIILFQIPISARVERWSRTRGLAAAALVTGAGYLVLASTPRLWHLDPQLSHLALAAAVVILTVAEMIETPLTFTLASEMAPAGSRGGAMGVLGLAAPLGMGLAPLLAGLVSAQFAWPYVWHVFAALVLLEGIGFLVFGRRIPKAADQPEALAETPAA